jgi:hypothetical protein
MREVRQPYCLARGPPKPRPFVAIAVGRADDFASTVHGSRVEAGRCAELFPRLTRCRDEGNALALMCVRRSEHSAVGSYR